MLTFVQFLTVKEISVFCGQFFQAKLFQVAFYFTKYHEVVLNELPKLNIAFSALVSNLSAVYIYKKKW